MSADTSAETPMDAERKRLAERLKETREFLGLSQQEAASAAGLTRLALSAIETERRRVESIELQSLANVYGQPVSYFLESTPEGSEDRDLRFLARAAKELTQEDRGELLRFAAFLKGYRAPSKASDSNE